MEEMYEYVIPAHYVPVIENDDRTHLSDEEEKEVDSFLNDVLDSHGEGTWEHVRNLGFQYRNDVNRLGGQCDLYWYHAR